jgi:hypothetical protein
MRSLFLFATVAFSCALWYSAAQSAMMVAELFRHVTDALP